MAYDSEIRKTELKELVELYRIDFGDGTVLRLTSYDEGVDGGDGYYAPAVIKRSEIKRDLDLRSSDLTIAVAADDTAIREALSRTFPMAKVTLTRLFLSGEGERVVWKGYVRSVAARTHVVTLKCAPIHACLDAKLPRYSYQSICNHQLFDDRCGLSADAYKVTTTVTVDGNTLRSSAFDEKPEGYFTLGKVVYSGDVRLITHHEGDTIWLQAAFDDSPNGKTVDVYPGCDKKPETCKRKFNNLENFLGFPYIPLRNPVIWGI